MAFFISTPMDFKKGGKREPPLPPRNPIMRFKKNVPENTGIKPGCNFAVRPGAIL